MSWCRSSPAEFQHVIRVDGAEDGRPEEQRRTTEEFPVPTAFDQGGIFFDENAMLRQHDDDEETLFPSRPTVLPDEMKGLLLLPSEADSESTTGWADASDQASDSGTPSPLASGGQDEGRGAIANILEVVRHGVSGAGVWLADAALVGTGESVFFSGCMAAHTAAKTAPEIVPECTPRRYDSSLGGAPTLLVEVEGCSRPIPAKAAVGRLARDGSTASAPSTCDLARLHYDPSNAEGSTFWGAGADGAIVVVEHSEIAHQDVARNAETSGAVGVVIISDHTREAGWTEAEEAGPDEKALEVTFNLPMVLIPRSHRDRVCNLEPGATAAIVCR
mmetsp:Transcript_92008/g.265474  ORF Transcript_92008/g.265474 Transcript_92008/m.265474 type:complete len:332 (+) Transcript_92008:120-1115(+)